jgi:uracil phosphoribosyltransferase
MADLAASAVTVVDQWTEGDLTGKRRVCKVLRLALTGQGGTTNKITAAVLGFSKIQSCSNALDYTNGTKVIPAVPNAAGTAILLADAANATATSHMTPGDATGFTIQLEVAGIPA